MATMAAYQACAQAAWQIQLTAHAGIHIDTDYNRRIIPVLIYHTVEVTEPMLLTGGVRAQAFDDMVVAVSHSPGADC
jgi:hypothetical protein